jgi:hypothetical protein
MELQANFTTENNSNRKAFVRWCLYVRAAQRNWFHTP